MTITSQQINEILAKGNSKHSNEIKMADAFLKKESSPISVGNFQSKV